MPMPTVESSASIVPIKTPDELSEARLEAVGYIFHGIVPDPDAKRTRAGANLLHFARCAKLEKTTERETKFWFRTIRIAKQHLDGLVGEGRWKWCKLCEREVTQRLLNE